jgi:plasmid stabilization system protein ParE
VNQVRFRKSAQADVQNAFEYFEGQSPGLGAEFLERVEEAADRISRNPEIYQTVVIACLAHRQNLSLARRRALRTVEPS